MSLPQAERAGDGDALTALRLADRDRFLCVLAAPARQRADLATLYLFNAEIAGIAEKVREPMLGLIRLQWWRDALAEIAAGKPHRHHLVQALADIAARTGLDPMRLSAMLDVRERDIDPAPPADLAALEDYAAATAGALAEAALDICRRDAAAELRIAARQAGTAYGLIGLLRATPYFARRRIVRLPAAEMAEAGSSIDLLCDLRPDAQLKLVVARVAARAENLLAESSKGRADSAAIAAFLPGKLARLQLERLRRHGYDPFAPGATHGSGLDIWRLLATRYTGRF